MTLATEDLEVLIERCENAVLRYRAGRRSGIEAAIEAGKMLTQMKGRMGHGDWIKHVVDLKLTERTVQRWMRMEQWSINASTVIDLGGIRATDEALNKIIIAGFTTKVQAKDMSIQEAIAQIERERDEQEFEQPMHAEATVVDGAVTGITVTNPGQGWPTPPPEDEGLPGINNVDSAFPPSATSPPSESNPHAAPGIPPSQTAPSNPPPATDSDDTEETEDHPANVTLPWDKYAEMRDRPLQLVMELEAANEQVRLLSEENKPDPDTSAVVAQQRDLINHLETELRKVREERNTYHDLSRRQAAVLSKMREQEAVDTA